MLNLSSKFKQDCTQQDDAIEMNIQPIDCGSIWEQIWIKLRFQTMKMVKLHNPTHCNQLKHICRHKLMSQMLEGYKWAKHFWSNFYYHTKKN